MLRSITVAFVLAASIMASVNRAEAQKKETGTTITKVTPLNAREIRSSRWSIGGETLDRDYADYHSYKKYLDSLGAKRIRLQGGWAKCEQKPGVYDFAWLDSIVDDAKARGVEPWLQLSYGNPIYPGGGQPILAGGIPTSPEALKAWDNWVVAMVRHFKDRVYEWELWNEPDISKKFHAKDFIPFYERTAELVRKEQPSSRLIALGLADVNKVLYVDSLLSALKTKNRLDFVNVITYHGYTVRPEDNYPRFEKLKTMVKGYSPEIELWQGENGAPSTKVGEAVGALTKEDWSEVTQAKWNLRRMFGDMAYGVDVTNIFQISDMYYAGTDHLVGLNSKGLLKARPDKTIERPKVAYKAFQHAASVFHGKITRLPRQQISHNDAQLMAYAYLRDGVKEPAITLWSAEGKPSEQYAPRMVAFTIEGVKFTKPVMIDLLTGKVTGVLSQNIRRVKNGYAFVNVPVTDSPMVVTDESWLRSK